MATKTKTPKSKRVAGGAGAYRSPKITRHEHVTIGGGYRPEPHETGFCKVLSEKRKGGPRKNCPVQLTFVDGRPAIRMCTKGDAPGARVLVPANGAATNRIARDICAHWKRTGRFPTASQLGLEDAGLGGRGRRKRRR